MKKQWFLIVILIGLVVIVLFSGCRPSSDNHAPAGNSPGSVGGRPGRAQITNDGVADCLADQLLVRLKLGADIDTVLSKIGSRITGYNEKLDYYLITFSPSDKMNLRTARNRLLSTKQTQVVEANYLYQADMTPNDPYYDTQWGLQRINAAAAWEKSTGLDTVVIAVVDTGVDHNHPDLAGKVRAGYDVIRRSKEFPGDPNGHGTHVAGIAAAKSNNNQGVAGVAWNSSLLAVRVLDEWGEGSIDDICDGIMWAVQNGADVINLSLGGPGYSRILQDAVDYALNENVVVVAAAGNDSKCYIHYPAAYPGVIAVGATAGNQANDKATFSTSSNYLCLATPGERIFSTLPNSCYGYLDGTSMATPFVSGAVALIKAYHGKSLDINQIRSQLVATANDIGVAGWDRETGAGLLNLDAALGALSPNIFGDLIVTVDDGRDNLQSNAHVLLKDSQGRGVYSALTNEAGEACFWSLAAGTYTVIAEKFSYRGSDTVTVSAGSASSVTVSLEIP